MLHNYGFYEPFRVKTLTDAEAEKKAAAQQLAAKLPPDAAAGAVPGHAAPDPMTKFNIELAVSRAEEQLKVIDMPEGEDIGDRYPDIDPLGHFCSVDMDFARREKAIVNTCSMRPKATRDYIAGLFAAMEDPSNLLSRQPEGVRKECSSIRTHERAAKLALTEDASRRLAGAADRERRGPGIRQYDALLTAMEQLCGLKSGTPARTTKELLLWARCPIPAAVLAEQDKRNEPPQALTVNFTDLDHYIQQNYFSSPRHWGRDPHHLPEDRISVQALDRFVDRYAGAAAGSLLNQVFSQPERETMDDIKPCSLNRGNLIAIDGKTVEELMHDRFLSLPPTAGNYEKWYKDNCLRMTSELVAAGLLAGKRVEAFVPDHRGRIPAEPVQITRSGYEPTALEPVKLTALERFFNKFGFFKEKAAKEDEYNRAMACRERMQKKCRVANAAVRYSGAGDSLKAMFFGDQIPRGNMDKKYYYSVSRSGCVSTCICALAARGCSLQDIADPDMLQQEKRAVGREYLQHLQAEDGDWLGDILARGQKAILDQMDRQPGLFTPEGFLENVEVNAIAGSTLFDSFQNKGHCLDAYKTAAAKIYPNLPDPGTYLDNCASGVSAYLTSVMEGLHAQYNFGALEGGLGEDLRKIAHGEFLQDYLALRDGADPDDPLRSKVDFLMIGAARDQITFSDEFRVLSSQCLDQRETCRQINDLIRDGNLNTLFRATVDTSQPVDSYATKVELDWDLLDDMALEAPEAAPDELESAKDAPEKGQTSPAKTQSAPAKAPKAEPRAAESEVKKPGSPDKKAETPVKKAAAPAKKPAPPAMGRH